MTEPKTGVVLREWLDRILGPHVPPRTRGVAHGGTLLTLRGIKDTTKDVDFAFIDRGSFDACDAALLKGRYRLEADFQAVPGEIFRRYRNDSEAVDLVDLRFPTWNSWVMKGSALRGCTLLAHGRFELLQPDIETTFVFKTYPCRPADLSDLQRIVERVPILDWVRVRLIIQEQEGFAIEKENHSTALVIAESRGRAYASAGVLLQQGDQRVAAFYHWARVRWQELGFPPETAQEVLDLIRQDHDQERSDLPWRNRLHDHEDVIRDRLRLPAGPA